MLLPAALILNPVRSMLQALLFVTIYIQVWDHTSNCEIVVDVASYRQWKTQTRDAYISASIKATVFRSFLFCILNNF